MAHVKENYVHTSNHTAFVQCRFLLLFDLVRILSDGFGYFATTTPKRWGAYILGYLLTNNKNGSFCSTPLATTTTTTTTSSTTRPVFRIYLVLKVEH